MSSLAGLQQTQGSHSLHASGGLGTINAHGLKHEGDEYSNDAYGKTPATIHLKVQGGVGQINLIQEP